MKLKDLTLRGKGCFIGNNGFEINFVKHENKQKRFVLLWYNDFNLERVLL